MSSLEFFDVVIESRPEDWSLRILLLTARNPYATTVAQIVHVQFPCDMAPAELDPRVNRIEYLVRGIYVRHFIDLLWWISHRKVLCII